MSKHLGVKKGRIDHLEFPEKQRMVSKDDESSSNLMVEAVHQPPPQIAMSCLVWNCHELGNPCIENELADLVGAKDPPVVFLTETWADEAKLKNVLRKIRCENIFSAPRTNRGGGLGLFWRSSIDATVEGSGTNYIDATFQEEDRVRIRVIIQDYQGKGLTQWSEIIPLLQTVVELEF